MRIMESIDNNAKKPESAGGASEQSLKAAYLSACNANMAKTEFLSKISHDIRTPMNAIIGMTAIAAAHIEDHELVRSSLEKIAVSSQQMMLLMEEIQDISRIEAGKQELNEAPFDMAEVIGEALETLSVQARAYGLRFDAYVGDLRHTEVIGDRKRIMQAGMNVANNAIKYTPIDGVISVHVSELEADTPDKVVYELVVEDNGIGMSPELLEHIFDPFVEDEAGGALHGTGLGLPLAKSFLDLMGGTIEVESALQQGSRFTLRIPLKLQQLHGAADNAEQAVSDSDDANVQGLQKIEATDYSHKRILLVEDNEFNRDLEETILSYTGALVETASNGQEAVLMVNNRGDDYYHLVLMDIEMPVMNGYEATRRIRQIPGVYAQQLPIVAVSANTFAADVDAAREAGMDEHLAKPMELAKLEQLLKKYLG